MQFFQNAIIIQGTVRIECRKFGKILEQGFQIGTRLSLNRVRSGFERKTLGSLTSLILYSIIFLYRKNPLVLTTSEMSEAYI